MTRPTRSLGHSLLLLIPFAAGLLSGCGDPAPSTKLAPDKPAPDASKMSPEQVDAMLKQNGAGAERSR